MKTDQPHVSDILRGKLSNFTIDRLLRCLLALGQDVEKQAPLAVRGASKRSSKSK